MIPSTGGCLGIIPGSLYAVINIFTRQNKLLKKKTQINIIPIAGNLLMIKGHLQLINKNKIR